MMKPVGFTRMADGTQEDYDLLAGYEATFEAQLPARLEAGLAQLDKSFDGYRVSRLTHSLQTATRAIRDSRDDEYVAMALLHDIGDILAPYSHSELAAAVLRPFVRPEIVWIAGHHGIFQMYYYGHFRGLDRNARERYQAHEWYASCSEFCELYDQVSFDPDYESLDLPAFRPVLEAVFDQARYAHGGS